MGIVNIGILAHVDAGKTTLTERILFETGFIKALGSVDKGTTQTDTLALERSRGITIQAAVASFQLHTHTINLIDTPGHADFIAEVERSLRILDGVVLVISAVEGVQPQTRRLVHAIRAARLPLLIFINKIDRIGARDQGVLNDIRQKLDLRIVPCTAPTGLGERSATVTAADRTASAWQEPVIDLLAETNEQVIAEFERTDGQLSQEFITAALCRAVVDGEVVPVYFGSAITGVGVPALLAGIEEWLATDSVPAGEPVSGLIFKITRKGSGEKVAYIRLFTGHLAVRQRVILHRQNRFGETEAFEERITGIDRFTAGTANQAEQASAGEIVIAHGLRTAQIGDYFGEATAWALRQGRAFPAPALESVVQPNDPAQIAQLRTALEQMAEQDPLIALRQRNDAGEVSVRLYGEVQKEVLLDTLAQEYGIGVTFGPSQTICIERLVGTGEAASYIGHPDNPFYATIAFQIAPARPDSGLHYSRELGSLPPAFYRAIEETIHETLKQGLLGWEVPDCAVTLTTTGYSSPLSTAADFRNLVPLVLMEAMHRAGTLVCEPFDELLLDIPADTYGAVCSAVLNARGTLQDTQTDGETSRLVCLIPTAELRAIEQQLPRLTRGDGGWESHFAAYIPITTTPPARERVGPNPLNRPHYLAEIARL